MTLQCGIVGLPNVGKSTLFNAITKTMNAESANYPFCTIEPNVGRIEIKDLRLEKLCQIANSQRIIRNQIDIVDIAGLVAGASKGEGLGNQFLANIREVDAILHVVRCFDDKDIIHVSNHVNPISDIETINTELILADIETIEKIIKNLEKKLKANKEFQKDLTLAQEIFKKLSEGVLAKNISCSEDELKIMKTFHLLTAKPTIYIANLDEASIKNPMANKHYKTLTETLNNEIVIAISSKFEMELLAFEEEDRMSMLNEMGLTASGLDNIAKESYKILNLISFFTVGPQETHAWTVKKNSTAPQAAGVIHTDFEKGFIKAETISYEDFVEYNGELGAKNAGKMRLEGKEYIVKDGDIMHFKFNV